jgi:adenylosuccinate lyase
LEIVKLGNVSTLVERRRANTARVFQPAKVGERANVENEITRRCQPVGDEGRYLHLGLTSSDVVDTAFALQLRDAADQLLVSLGELRRDRPRPQAGGAGR